MANDLRLVTAADLPAVIALVSATLAEHGLEFGKGAATDDGLRALPGAYLDHGGAFWVARDRATDALAGTCGVFPVAPGVYELRKMYLAPAARGLGLGARLLDTAVAWTRAAGGHLLVLDTADTMARAIGFYEARGFVRDDAQIRSPRATRGYARRLDAELGRYVVWRQDDNGNRVEVARTASQAEADAIASAFEARGHKQLYWVEVVAALP